MLYVVVGPPAAGKSTWVLERAKPGDVVVDFDRLAMALSGQGGDLHDHPPAVTAVTKAARRAAIDVALRRVTTCNVYIIHSSPSPERMADYRAHGAEVITIDPGRDVVRERCKAERPQRMFGVVDRWYREQTEGGRVRKPRVSEPAYSFPTVTSRDW